MIAVADERSDPSLVEALQSRHEPELRLKAAISAVEHVACDQQGIDILLDAQINDLFVGVECRVAQSDCDAWNGRGYPLERTIEMEIGCVHEPDE